MAQAKELFTAKRAKGAKQSGLHQQDCTSKTAPARLHQQDCTIKKKCPAQYSRGASERDEGAQRKLLCGFSALLDGF
jgi:hypothetical protein